MPNPDRVALGAMAGTGTEPTGGNGVSKAQARLNAIAEMPDFDDGEAPAADPGPDAAAPVEAKKEPEPKVEADKPADPGDAQLSALKKREARQREEFATAKADLDKQKADLAEQLQMVEKFKALQARARLEPDAALAELLGTDIDDDLATLATRRFWARTKKGQEQPQSRQLAEQLTKERAITEKVSTVEKTLLAKVEALEAKLTAKEQAETAATFEREFLGGVKSALSDTTPLVKDELEADPEDAKEGLAKAKMQLWERDGDEPEYVDVVAHYEKTLAEKYAKRGLTRAPAKAADKKAATEKAAPSKSLTGDLAAGTKPIDQRKKTREELRAEAIRDMPDFDD